MKKIYSILSMVLATSALIAGGINNPNIVNRKVMGLKPAALLSTEKNPNLSVINPSPFQVSAIQAAPFYTENFSSGTTSTLPTGWSVSNSNSTTANWAWKIGGGGGQFPVAALAANANTTPANGSMIYDSDNLCGASGVSAKANLTSPVIDCSAHTSVKLNFYESYTAFNDSTYIEVSNNNTTWTKFSIAINDGTAANGSVTNPTKVGVNITSVAAGQATVYIRFVFVGGSVAGCDYGWIVDDIALTELPNNDLSLVKEYFDVTNGSTPISQLDTIFFSGRVANSGSAAQATTSLKAKVKLNNGTLLHTTTSSSINLAVNTDSLISCPIGFLPSAKGLYRTVYNTFNDTVTDASLSDNSDSTQFQISDSTFQAAISGYAGGYYLYNSTTSDQFNWGLIFDVINTDTLTSVGFATRTATTAGQSFTFELHKFENSAWTSLGTVDRLVATSDISAASGAIKDISAAFLLSNNTYPILDAGSYAITISGLTLSATSTILGSTVFPGNSVPVIYDATQTQPFSLTSVAPYLKVNFGKPNPYLSVSEVKNSSLVSIFPNPTNNILNIKMTAGNTSTAKLININGQVVYTENVSNKTNATIDMNAFAKGVYTLQIVSDNGVATQKVIKQ